MSTEDKPKITLESIAPLLKDVYQDYAIQQLNSSNLFFGNLSKPVPLTRKQKFIKKWKRFWNHIPDFLDYLRSYEYENWRYWDKDGY